MNWPNSTYSLTSLKIINLFDYEDIQQDDAIQNIVTRLFHDINNQMPSRVLDPESDIEITDINGERHDEFCNEPVEISNVFSRPTLIVDRFRETLRNLRQRTGNPNEVYYYHSDHLGSASWITDNTGIPIQHLQYLPFGEPFVSQRISGYNERFTFTGNDPRQGWRTPLNNIIYSEQRDEETGYGYFGARYMDHELMTMWLSVDPMADKYPSKSPYNYCAWNPVKLVDPDGREMTASSDWYKDAKGNVHWDANVHSQADLKNGETYIGRTDCMVAEGDDNVIYGDQYGQTHNSIPLKSVEVTYTRTDHERTMANPVVKSIHQSAESFWGHPATQFVTDAILFVITGGIENISSGAARAFSRYQAKHFFKGASYSPKVRNAVMSNADFRHAFPSSVDTYAAKFGEYSSRTGADGTTYKWLTMNGSYKNTSGQFEYIKNNKGIINHRFLNIK